MAVTTARTVQISRRSRNLAYAWKHIHHNPITADDMMPVTTTDRMTYKQVLAERERERRESAWTINALYVDGKRVAAPVNEVLDDLAFLSPGQFATVEVEA